jgi:fumarate reductase iron-sulfur subunit
MNKLTICNQQYEFEKDGSNLLDILIDIKENQNNKLAFRYGCKSGICGSCSVRVNSVEQLACMCKISNNDIVEPLKNLTIIRDLVVDESNIKSKLTQAKANMEEKSSHNITQEDVEKIDIQSNCILCNSCYSSCPIYEVNEDFIGPFALTRSYRYIEDKKESNIKSKLDAIQINGIWDCTLCGACSLVCPQNIDIKNDIMLLQNISIQNSYENPKFSQNDDFNSFSDDFGFNPNQF